MEAPSTHVKYISAMRMMNFPFPHYACNVWRVCYENKNVFAQRIVLRCSGMDLAPTSMEDDNHRIF